MSKFPSLVVSTVLLLMVWGIGVSEAAAQEGEAIQETEGTTAPASSEIGLLDVGRAFKNYPRFLDSMAELKVEVEKAEAELKQEKSEVENLIAQLQIHPQGSDEHARLKELITTANTELTDEAKSRKKDFVHREARIYHDVYRDIVEQSKQYARQNGIIMVLRFSSEKPNVDDPQSVLKHINKPTVWYDEDRDITEAVLRRLIERWKEKSDEEESPAEELVIPTPGE